MNYRSKKIAKNIEQATGRATATDEVAMLIDPSHSSIGDCLILLKPLLDLSEVNSLQYDWFVQCARFPRLIELEGETVILSDLGHT